MLERSQRNISVCLLRVEKSGERILIAADGLPLFQQGLFLFRFIWYTNNTANAHKDLHVNQLVNIYIHHNKCKYQNGSPKVWVNTNMAPIILHSTLHSVIKAQQLHKYIIRQLNKYKAQISCNNARSSNLAFFSIISMHS